MSRSNTMDEQETTEGSLGGNSPPSSLTQVGIITKYEIINYFRAKRFFILLAIALAFSALSMFLTAHFGIPPGGTLGFYLTWWGESYNFLVVFSAIFFGGDAISGEFQNKTGYFLVGNPIRRSSIYVGKWIAALIASLIIIGIDVAIAVGNAVYYYGTAAFPSQFGESLIFTVVYLIAALGLTFFVSSLFKSSSYSIIVSFVLLLIVFSTVEGLITIFAHTEPWYLLSYGAEIIRNVLISPYPPHTSTGAGILGGFNVTIPEGLIIMLVYFAVTAVLGLVLFERKEFN